MAWYYRHFPRSRPRRARGGIKAQSQRGQIGESWWARRWIDVLESFNIGGRLSRGRSYARGGQVLEIDVGKGKVTARVQGSMPRPYSVSIEVQKLSNKEWDKLLKELAGQALFAARLLAGEMPQDIETVFDKADLSLFPSKRGDLTTACSCPDYSNPCKHIAAVYYLLGEEFDRDPFLLFKLRGLDRDELLARLNAQAPAAAAADEPAAPAAEPLPTAPAEFWLMGSLPDDLHGEVKVPSVSAAWLRRLGNFPFWRGGERFVDALEPVYHEAARRGLARFLGEPGQGS